MRQMGLRSMSLALQSIPQRIGSRQISVLLTPITICYQVEIKKGSEELTDIFTRGGEILGQMIPLQQSDMRL